MRKPDYRTLFVVVLVGVSVLVLLTAYLTLATGVQADKAQEMKQYQPRTLVGASSQDIERAAIEYAQAAFQTANSFTLLQQRAITTKDLPRLGLDKLEFLHPDYQLTLVILKGEADLSKMPGALVASQKASQKANYLGLVFDTKTGVPSYVIASPSGNEFRFALNNMILPDDTITNKSAPAKEAPAVSPAPPLWTMLTPSSEPAPTVRTDSK
jgi:hypothetical protein